MIIRDLKSEDVPTLIEWLREFSDGFDYPGKGPIDNEAATQFASSFINNQSHAAIVAEENEKLIAVLAFTILPHPWTGRSVFFKAFWYSAKPGAGIELYRYARDLCKAAEIDQMVISSMTPRVDRLLRREGFKPCEMNYILDLKGD